jgi:hypothetical protein
MCQAPGATGQAMHGRPYRFQLDQMHAVANRVGRIQQYYGFEDGRCVTNQINAGWQLGNAGPGDGVSTS